MAEYIDRYIPASYLFGALGMPIDGACGKCHQTRTDCMCQSLSRMDICGIIEDAPSADVRENVLGYWDIHRGNWADEFECSVCHKISKTGGNYCFNCGADMREVQDAK